MRALQASTVLTGVVMALEMMIAASPAQTVQRLQSVVQRVSAPEGQTNATTAKTFRIAGTAVDADGKPVAGAVVECYQHAGSRLPFVRLEMEVKQRVTTGTNGAYEFLIAPGSTMVLGQKPGLAPGWSQYWTMARDLTAERLFLTTPTNLTGVVVDEADKPVPDAEVWVCYACIVREKDDGGLSYNYLNDKPTRDCFAARTAADGRFIIQGFPTNASADLAVSKPGKVLRELQRDGVSPETMRYQPGQQEVKLILEPAATIEGKVVARETSQPLPGALLWLQETRSGLGRARREPAQSAADGTFRIADVPAGAYNLSAAFGTNPVPDWVAEVVPVNAEAGKTTSDVQVTATKGGFLAVTVLGSDNHAPVKQATVSAVMPGYQGSAITGSNGVAILRVPSGGLYSISAYKENSRREGSPMNVQSGTTNRIEIELDPPPRIAGVVRDPSGAPMPGLELSIFPNWGQSGGGAKTDAKGRYEMSWNPQRVGPGGGSSCLVARDVPRNLATAQDIEESTSTLDLRLEPGLVVTGRVEGEDGKPLSNATVRVFLWSGNSGSQFDEKGIRTDAQGRFEVTAMPPGRKYSLDATAKGYGSVNRMVQENADTNRVELEPCVLKVADRKLAGEVVDADEKPVARANVYMYGQGQPNGSVRTDDKGRFRFEAVCEGTIQLSASAQNAHGSARAEAGDTNVVIHLGVNQSYSVRQAPKRPSLKGKPLPDLAAVELGGDAIPVGKPVLLCLFDVEQRPSRRFVKQLAEQHDALKQKGITVLGLQAAITSAESIKEWKGANPVPFPVGRVAEKADKTKWASDAESLPWLILTDGERRVTAEGFALDELEAKIKSQAK